MKVQHKSLIRLFPQSSTQFEMRLLCFHGIGTNGKIFEKQTERLRQALGRSHEFVFLTGTVPVDPTPGSGCPAGESYRFISTDKEQNKVFHRDLLRAVQDLGPFDGVVGFSEGGAVAASLLVEDGRRPVGNFKCGIFFCAASPPDPDNVMTGDDKILAMSRDGVVLDVPTAHIWSDSGEVHPGMGGDLVLLCNEDMREEFVHCLGHQVPGTSSDEGLSGTVKVIERTMERARA